MIKLICHYCGADFYKCRARQQASGRDFCTRDCFLNYKKTRVPIQCGFCNNTLHKERAEVGKSKSGFSFCNRSCAACYNNKFKQKRLPEGKCRVCGGLCNSRVQRCRKCYIDYKQRSESMTVGELSCCSRRSIANTIRLSARTSAKRWGWIKSCFCGYNTFVELCHIKPISSFDKKARISDINSKENLIYLCPNHHKELDCGLLSLDAVYQNRTDATNLAS